MEDFSAEKALLEKAGCGVTIRNADELLQGILQALDNPEELQRRGDRGKSVVLANIGAAARYADLISKNV
jgi:3-deoxy-D-manno-octulosonic-acid transferase